MMSGLLFNGRRVCITDRCLCVRPFSFAILYCNSIVGIYCCRVWIGLVSLQSHPANPHNMPPATLLNNRACKQN